MTPTENIFRSLKCNDRLRILTIPSDPIFDHLLALGGDLDDYHLLLDSDQYHSLPHINILNGMPVGTEGFDLMVAFETESAKAIEIANGLHIPLIIVSFSNKQYRCTYQLTLGKSADFISTHVKVPTANKLERKSGKNILCRRECIDQVRSILKGTILPLEMNPIHRYEQYQNCGLLINLVQDIYCVEIEECIKYGIKCMTISNPYHTNIPYFRSTDELERLISSYNSIRKADVDLSGQNIFQEIHSIGIRTRENGGFARF